ncbi:hypothetical protein HYPGJ_31818 [Hyphomicrobium sp. GJ21]|nr:hypothetical protein HYPGJ_31818 [Hyphomicrobium sp. GJ21]
MPGPALLTPRELVNFFVPRSLRCVTLIVIAARKTKPFSRLVERQFLFRGAGTESEFSPIVEFR